MMDAFELLVDQIEDKVDQLKQAVASGRAETFEEYKRTCGEIKGLLVARGYILDLQDKMETSDE
jgi:uncharacterized protein YaaR (DUF327 family)